MTFNSYNRVTAKENKLNTFQDQELITDLDLNWVQFKWRNHDPSIGRFFNVDPLAADYTYNSPYAFQENKLGQGIELEGLELFGGAFTSKYVTMMAQWQAKGNGGALNSLVSGELQTPENYDNNNTQIDNKLSGQLNNSAKLAKTMNDNGRELGNEASKDGLSMVSAIGTGLEFTPAAPIGLAMTTVAGMLDEARQVEFENKDSEDAVKDFTLNAATNVGTGALGNIAKKSTKAVGTNEKTTDSVIDAITFGVNQFTHFFKNLIQENSSQQKKDPDSN